MPRIPSTGEYLETLMSDKKLKNYSTAAELLGVSRNTVARLARNENQMEPYIAVRVALLLELPILAVIAATRWHAAKNDEEKAVWDRVYCNYVITE